MANAVPSTTAIATSSGLTLPKTGPPGILPGRPVWMGWSGTGPTMADLFEIPCFRAEGS